MGRTGNPSDDHRQPISTGCKTLSIKSRWATTALLASPILGFQRTSASKAARDCSRTLKYELNERREAILMAPRATAQMLRDAQMQKPTGDTVKRRALLTRAASGY